MPKVEYQIDLLCAAAAANSTTYIDISYASRQAVLIDITKFVSPSFYFEAMLKAPVAGNTSYAQLVSQGTSDSTDAAATPVSGSEVSEPSTSWTRKRSGAITLTSGNRYRVQIKNTTASTEIIIRAARIIVVDDVTAGWTKGEEAVEIVNPESASPGAYKTLDHPPIFKYEAAKRDGTIAVYFEACLFSGTAARTVKAQLIKSTSPDMSSPAAVAGSEVSVAPATANVPVRVRTAATITLEDGYYYAVQYTNVTAGKIAGITGAKIIIQQSGTITKTQLRKRIANRFSTTSLEPVRLNNQVYVDKSNLPSSLTFYHQNVTKVDNSANYAYQDLWNVEDASPIDGTEINSTVYIWYQYAWALVIPDLRQYDARLFSEVSPYTSFMTVDWIVIDAALVAVVETIVAKEFPMLYYQTTGVKELRSKVSGATVTKIAKDFPEALLKTGKAKELRSKWS